jgi:hypothetical protein
MHVVRRNQAVMKASNSEGYPGLEQGMHVSLVFGLDTMLFIISSSNVVKCLMLMPCLHVGLHSLGPIARTCGYRIRGLSLL